MATPLFFLKTTYLVDGYNLIHAIGLLPKKAGPGGLEKARRALLGLLHGHFGDESSAVTVVFDAAKAPPRSMPEQVYQGLRVQFATGGLLADDVIEALIQQEAAPKQLTVVSNDHRLQKAARRRHAHVMSCEHFLDLLEKRKPSAPSDPAPPAEKTENMTEAERKRWLEEFGHLDKDLEDLNFRFDDQAGPHSH
jgi:predicted RNA-binding protein with PIN domain